MENLQKEVIDTVIRKVNKNEFDDYTVKLPTVDRGIWSHFNHKSTKLCTLVSISKNVVFYAFLVVRIY